ETLAFVTSQDQKLVAPILTSRNLEENIQSAFKSPMVLIVCSIFTTNSISLGYISRQRDTREAFHTCQQLIG
uniref:Uncharacterized protein n=1 Tax=Amphimedon queenslandica TaxID=400682 RepID=A0A1X7V8K2_AMPQE